MIACQVCASSCAVFGVCAMAAIPYNYQAMPEIREPNRRLGVPKETRDQNSIAHLQEALRAAFPERDWALLAGQLEGNGFFEAGMQQQVRIMAEKAAVMLPVGRTRYGFIRHTWHYSV